MRDFLGRGLLTKRENMWITCLVFLTAINDTNCSNCVSCDWSRTGHNAHFWINLSVGAVARPTSSTQSVLDPDARLGPNTWTGNSKTFFSVPASKSKIKSANTSGQTCSPQAWASPQNSEVAGRQSFPCPEPMNTSSWNKSSFLHPLW